MLTLAEEARFRLVCCKADTGDGWGEVRSLRNHMCCVQRDIDELKPLMDELDERRGEEVVQELMQDEHIAALAQEYAELTQVTKEVNAYLGIFETGGTVSKREDEMCRLGREGLKRCLKQLGVPV